MENSIREVLHFFEAPRPTWPQADDSVGVKFSDIDYWNGYVLPIANYVADQMADVYISWLKEIWEDSFSGKIICQRKKAVYLMRHAVILDMMKSLRKYGLDPQSMTQLIPPGGDRTGWMYGMGQKKQYALKNMDALLYQYARFWEITMEEKNYESIYEQWSRKDKLNSMKIKIPDADKETSKIDCNAKKYILEEDSFYRFCFKILMDERSLPRKTPEQPTVPIPKNLNKLYKKFSHSCPAFAKYHQFLNTGTRLQMYTKILQNKKKTAKAQKEKTLLLRMFKKYGGDEKRGKNDWNNEEVVSDTDDDENKPAHIPKKINTEERSVSSESSKDDNDDMKQPAVPRKKEKETGNNSGSQLSDSDSFEDVLQEDED